MDGRVIVELKDVSKKFEKKTILKNFNLSVYEGEFLTLLGSSGCGKTTILRLISGLDTVSSGNVFIDGEDVTRVDATKRKVNTIFQNYALFEDKKLFINSLNVRPFSLYILFIL